MKQTAKAVIATLLAALLGFVVSPLARELWSFAAETFLPKLSKQGQLSLVATLSILCLVLGTLLYRASSIKILMRKYVHVESRGFWVHRKTNLRVCGNCLFNGIKSPLTLGTRYNQLKNQNETVWACGIKSCSSAYAYKDGDETL